MVTPLHIILSLALIASVRAAEWQTIQVPGATKQTGTAWLRAWGFDPVIGDHRTHGLFRDGQGRFLRAGETCEALGARGSETERKTTRLIWYAELARSQSPQMIRNILFIVLLCAAIVQGASVLPDYHAAPMLYESGKFAEAKAAFDGLSALNSNPQAINRCLVQAAYGETQLQSIQQGRGAGSGEQGEASTHVLPHEHSAETISTHLFPSTPL